MELPLDAIADPTRRRVFELLSAHGPQAVGELASHLPVSRPAVSQHLKVLGAAGLVSVEAAGRRRVYRAEPAGLAEVREWVERHWDLVLDRFVEAAGRQEAAMRLDTELDPIVKRRVVPIPRDAAFTLFTQRIAEWWPTATHSIAKADVAGLRFEGRVGGRLVEVTRDGGEHAWADVLAWDPPRRLVLSWHPDPAPVAASRLEVRFAPVAGGTELTLVHTAWEEFGERGAALRSSYDEGWDVVLGALEAAVAGRP